MITVHHLENSRSQRVLWLLEELELDYEVRRYERDRKTSLAPPELRAVHPTGKSPVITDESGVTAETGAIFDHIVSTYADGRLVPEVGTESYRRYRYWLHAAEGSYMPPLVLALLLGKMETAPMPFFVRPVARKLTGAVRKGYLNHTTEALFRHLEAELEGRQWLCGDQFTAVDIMMSFPVEAARTRLSLVKQSRTLMAYVERLHARPAYTRALERGGPYAYA